MNFYIYIYFDPTRDLEAFYVGKGKGTRSHCHLKRNDKHPFTHRLQKMARQGVIPYIERYEGLTEQAAFDLEKALIAEIGRRDLGTGPLLNLTDGGEGVTGQIISEAHRKKLSEKSRNMSVEARQKISDTHKGKKKSAEHVKKMKERVFTDEHRRKLSEVQKGKKKSDEHRAALSKGQTGNKWSEERKAAAKKARKANKCAN